MDFFGRGEGSWRVADRGELVPPLFRNRSDAGQILASELCSLQTDYSEKPVLALPRGGVPVGFEVAQRLNSPLDIFVVRKLGVPGHEELAFGAIASGGAIVIDHETIQHLGVTPRMAEAVVSEAQSELERREKLYRGDRPRFDVSGQHVILVDDGLATGASMRAAVKALRRHHPQAITVAVPVGAPETCELFRLEADQIVCARTPDPFFAVGMWYEDFTQTSDEEVIRMLNEQAHRQKASRLQRRTASEQE
jgi:putative phosphoribosyl transferase